MGQVSCPRATNCKMRTAERPDVRSALFSFSKSDRGNINNMDTPGPGHYVTRTEQRGHVTRAPMVSSSFLSQSDKLQNENGTLNSNTLAALWSALVIWKCQ